MRPPRPLLLSFVCALALALIPLALHPATPRANGYQHITNGSFEYELDGWGVGAGGAPSIATSGAFDGVRALRVEAGARVRIAQPLSGALPPGAYTLAYRARATASAGTITTTVESIGAVTPVLRRTDDITGENVEIAAGFSASIATQATLSIVITAPVEGAILLDDVRIDGAAPVTFTPTASATVPAPLPSATTLADATATTQAASPTPVPLAPSITGDIRNAGFEDRAEDGAPAAWEQYGGTLASSAQARSGASAARIESATDSTKWMHQAVAAAGGGTYEFAAWVQHDDPSVARALLRVSWYASADASGSNIGSDDSTAILDAPAPGYRFLTTGPITAPAEARSARVRVLLAPASAAPAAILVDDASFGPAIPLPPPAAEATTPAAGAPAGATSGDGTASASARRRGAASGFVAGAGAPPPEGARIVINEVLCDAAGEGADTDGEWVELYNGGDAPADLAGWRLADASAADILPPFVLEPGSYVVVGASDSLFQIRPDLAGSLIVVDGRIGNGLGNAGDTLLLVAPDGTWADAVSWGDDASALSPSVSDVPEGHSIERSPAGRDTGRASDFIDNAAPSPGGPVGSAPARPQPAARPRVEILAGDGAALAWLPWAIAAASLAALAGVASWRAIDVVRQRVRP